MKDKLLLQTIFLFTLSGLLYSCYLLYSELSYGGCNNSYVNCQTFELYQLPDVAYGGVMYYVILTIVVWGLSEI